MLPSRLLLGLIVAIVPLDAAAEPPPPASLPAPATTVVQNLPVTVVSGALPGPGLWKVEKSGHVLWILGTVTPLPKHMEWQSDHIAAVEQHADAVLMPPGIGFDAKIGFFGRLALLPRLIGVRNNPDDKHLVDVVPPVLYARWLPLKARYIGGSHRVEKYRPMFAGLKLYEAALDDADLKDKDIAVALVRKVAKKHDIPIVNTYYTVEIANPKQALKDFRVADIDDVACFKSMLDTVELRLPTLGRRANAWATGDIASLRATTDNSAGEACADAFGGASFGRQLGIDHLYQRVRKSWMTAADKALKEHATSFAVVEMNDLLTPDGYLAGLRAAGATVTAPDGWQPATSAPRTTHAPAPATSSAATRVAPAAASSQP